MNSPATRRPRALLDANILVSSLISPAPLRSAAAILEQAKAGACTVVVPFETLEEVQRVAADKPWLAARVPPSAIDGLVNSLRRVAELAPSLEEVPPRITRDPGDDYVFAQAILARVDFLVTRDPDLLSLGQGAGVTIVDPAAFLRLLREQPDRG